MGLWPANHRPASRLPPPLANSSAYQLLRCASHSLIIKRERFCAALLDLSLLFLTSFSTISSYLSSHPPPSRPIFMCLLLFLLSVNHVPICCFFISTHLQSLLSSFPSFHFLLPHREEEEEKERRKEGRERGEEKEDRVMRTLRRGEVMGIGRETQEPTKVKERVEDVEKKRRNGGGGRLPHVMFLPHPSVPVLYRAVLSFPTAYPCFSSSSSRLPFSSPLYHLPFLFLIHIILKPNEISGVSVNMYKLISDDV